MTDHTAEDEAQLRQDAIGAFSHEIRTPLTSMRMVLDLAGQLGEGKGDLHLDAEMATTLRRSLDALEGLANDFQEASRVERGRLAVVAGPATVDEAVMGAIGQMGDYVTLDAAEVPGEPGPWDEARLSRALAAFTEAANRLGTGEGTVTMRGKDLGEAVELAFASGAQGGGGAKKVGSDAGYAYYHARTVIEAMRGTVQCTREDGYACIEVRLPR